MRANHYRYPRERLVLALTVLLVGLVIALTATATVCLSVVFIAAIILISYGANRARHRALVAQALSISSQETPSLAIIADRCAKRLRVDEQVEVFVAPSDVLNAYTFGITRPKVVVLHSALMHVMDAEELSFVLGHEFGHIALGHTEINSLVGGMAGIPSPFFASSLLSMAFLWWNRACEFSADRAGMLACGSPRKAVSALVKLAAGLEARTQADLKRALQIIETEDDHVLAGVREALSTHPMIVRRIEELRRYARLSEYSRLRAVAEERDRVS
jgi:Zn-dependent protease with chaperone function